MSRKDHKGPKPKKVQISSQIPLSKVVFNPRKDVEFLIHGNEYPIYGCWIMNGWEASGIAPVIIARQLPDGRVSFANYLIDFYCLGVENAYTNPPMSEQAFNKKLPQLCSNYQQDPALSLWIGQKFFKHFSDNPAVNVQ